MEVRSCTSRRQSAQACRSRCWRLESIGNTLEITAPIAIARRRHCRAVRLRTVVFIGVSPAEEEALLRKLANRVEGRLDSPIVAVSEIEIGTSTKISGDLITVRGLSPSFFAIIADALAKNVALSFDEAEVEKVLEVLEPFTDDLADSGGPPRNRRQMLRTVGHALRIHHRLIERVEVETRPDLLRDDDEINRLHEELADAFHLKKRAQSLSRKLEVIEVTTTALTELIDAQREMRVELLIVILIAIEIGIWLYELFFGRG
jgi:uncharacterized Rmd1/YagE family protein